MNKNLKKIVVFLPILPMKFPLLPLKLLDFNIMITCCIQVFKVKLPEVTEGFVNLFGNSSAGHSDQVQLLCDISITIYEQY